jgi:SAM-dependent methyltransferase
MEFLADFFVAHWVVIIQSVIAASLLMVLWVYLSMVWGAPWIPSPLRVVLRMLALADIQPGQRVVDLGAGDGRIVILAARKYRAAAWGVEIDPVRAFIAKSGILLLGVRGRAKVVWGDFRRHPVAGADAVMLSLMQGTNQKLKENLQNSLRPGAKIISHLYSMAGWTPVALDERYGIFVYEIGKTGEDTETRIYS